MINDIFIVIVSFIGLIVGMVIALYTKEELKPGEKYFTWFKRTVLLWIILLFVYYSRNELLFLMIGLIAGFMFRLNVYLYLGIALASSFMIMQELIVASLIFLFGLPYGTLKAKGNLGIRHLKKPAVKHAAYFFMPFLILLIKPPLVLLTGFVTGGLIYNLLYNK